MGQVVICSRTLAHADGLKREFTDLTVIPYEKRYEIMKECDLVVSATASPHLVVRREHFTPIHPIVFLDLATPRDIDTTLEQDSRIRLINLDTLQEIVKENRLERERLVAESKSMITEDMKETCTWLLQSRMDSTIESLQQRCSGIVEDSYEYLDRKLQLNQREKKLLHKVLNASLQRLLREPIQELKQIETKEEQDKYQEFVKKLFQI